MAAGILKARLVAVILLVLVTSACSQGATRSDGPELEQFQNEFGVNPDALDLPSGSKVIFFGDSLTAGGVKPGGFVDLFHEAISGFYPKRDIKILGSGVVGNRVPDLAARLEEDVLANDPTHVVVFVGVNDVASLGQTRASQNAGVVQFRDGLTGLVARIAATGARVVLCTPGLIGEDVEQGTPANYGLELYASAVRSLAAELSTGLCDVRSEFTEYLSSRNNDSRRSGLLTVDGIHLNDAGNLLATRTMLRAFSGSGSPRPSPFVMPTVSPRPRAPLVAPSPTRRATQSPPAGPAPPEAELTPSEAATPLQTPSPDPPESPSPEAPPSPIVVETPDGFPFEGPRPTGASEGP